MTELNTYMLSLYLKDKPAMCLALRSGVEKEHRLCNQSDLGLTAGMAITS